MLRAFTVWALLMGGLFGSMTIQAANWYVNDASTVGDVNTTAVGNDANAGTAAAPFLTITFAINQAAPGDVIFVDAGTYVENLFVNKSLTITGVAGRDMTFVHAATAAYTLHVDGNAGAPVLSGNVSIEGFTFADPQRLHWCIVATDHIATGLQLTFRNNRVTDGNSYGLWDYHSHGILLCENNIFSNVYYGMLLEGWDTGAVTIQNNEFTNLHFYIDPSGMVTPAFGGPVGILPMTYSADGGVDCTNPYRIFENQFHTYFNDGFGIVFNGGLTGFGSAKYTDVEIARNTIAPGATGTGIRLRNLPAPNNSPNGGVHNALIHNNFISNVQYGIRLQGDNPGTQAHENSLVNCSIRSIENTGTLVMDATCNWYGTTNAATIATQISGSVTYSPFLTNGTDSAPATGFQPAAGACTGCTSPPTVSFMIGGSSVSTNTNGTPDPSESATVAVCNGGTYVLGSMLHGSGGLNRRYKVTVTSSGGGLLFNGSAAGPGDISAAQFSAAQGVYTVTLSNPAIGGSVVQVITPYDDNGDLSLGDGDCAGDPITITYVATANPSFSFTGNGDSSVGDNTVNVSLCSGGNLTLSAFAASSLTAQYHEVRTATPGLLYGASPITNATQNITAAAAPGYFGNTYGPYNNPTNAPGTITQVFTPYEDMDGNNQYDAGVDCAGTPVTLTITVNPTPQLRTSINGQVVTSNNDGTPDEGAFTVCNGASNNVVINSFSELQGITPSNNLRVYQTVALTNASLPYCNNCQALLSAFTPGLSATLALVNPAMPGSAVVTFQLWNDISPANGSIDPGECIGDVIRYTITINPVPTIAFTAQVTGRAAQNGNSATPTNVVLNFCAGESFSYSNYVSVPGNRVGVLEVLTGTGNVTYNGASVSVPRTQLDFGVGGTPGYFAGTYGPYGLSSGVSGNFVETFTPYYDSDNSGTYTPGDCLGNPVTITYNVYALPNAIATPSSQAICNNSATSIALSSNVPGTTFSWVVQSTTGTVTGQTGGNGPSIAQTLNNSGATPATVTYRITPTGPGPNNCVGPTTDVTVTVAPSPTVTCPASFTVNTSTDGTGNCSGTANWTHPTIAAGPCGPVTLTMSVDGGAPAAVTPGMAVSRVLTVGPHTVAYVVSDGKTPNPNTATCSFGITVVDDELPMVTCKPYSISFNGQDSLPVTAANLVLSSSDNCGIASTVLQYNKIGCQSVGTVVPVVVTVTDVNGLSNSCMANVTVGGLPCGWSSNSNSIGCTSNVVFTPGTGLFTTTASSCFYANPFTVDDVSFIQRRLCGDGSITTLVTSISDLGWAGVTMRESLAVGSKKAQLMTNLSSFSRREFRTATNGQAYPQQFPSQNRYWLRIVRAGNQFTMYVSPNGMAWYFAGVQNIVMDNCILIGLVTTNYTATTAATSVFSNVSFTGNSPFVALPGNGAPTGLADFSSELEVDFSVFPNPTSGELNLDLTQYFGRSVRIETYSLEGKLLQFTDLDEVQNTLERLDLSRFQNGMYLVKVKSDGLPEVARRVVKQ